MATIKSYTDISQSKKLAEILSLESANYTRLGKDEDNVLTRTYFESCSSELKEWVGENNIFPCWSLTALLNVIPKHIKDYNVLRIDISENNTSIWYDEVGYGVNSNLPDITMESAVDACVSMIEKLHKLKML